MKKYLFLIFSLSLFVFCLSQQLGIENIFCKTSGCELYKGMSFAGISFYGYGTILGILSTVLYFLKKHKALNIIIITSICFDVLLLLYQSFFWPCVNCLIVGVLIFGMFLSLPSKTNLKHVNSIIKISWIVFFSIASFGAVKEVIKPIPVYGTNESPIKVFFSPTCSSCKSVIDEIINNNLQEEVALYPVNKNLEDIEKIETLMCALDCGETLPVALEKCFSGAESKNNFTPYEIIKNRAILFSNKMYLSKIGSNTVPVIWNNKLEGYDSSKKIEVSNDMNVTPDLGNIFGSKQVNGCSLNAVVEKCE